MEALNADFCMNYEKWVNIYLDNLFGFELRHFVLSYLLVLLLFC